MSGKRKQMTFSEIVAKSSLKLKHQRVLGKSNDLLNMVGSRTGTQISHQPFLPRVGKPTLPVIIDQAVPK